MDPVSALGFAASIISVVDLCYKIVKGSYEIYRSESGAPQEHAHIGDVLDDLQGVAKSLVSVNTVEGDSPHRESLQKLAGDCVAASNELIRILQDVKRKEGNKIWRSLEAKWKCLRNEGALAALEQRLNFLRLELLLRLNLIIQWVFCLSSISWQELI